MTGSEAEDQAAEHKIDNPEVVQALHERLRSVLKAASQLRTQNANHCRRIQELSANLAATEKQRLKMVRRLWALTVCRRNKKMASIQASDAQKLS